MTKFKYHEVESLTMRSDIEQIVLKESEKIRVKALRKLIEMAIDYKKYDIRRAEDIVDKYGLSFRTAYDYFNTLELLKIIFNL